MNLDQIPKKELILLLIEYDKYINEANEEDKYKTGWKPVCIAEFYDNEFQEWLEEIKRGN